MLYSKSAVCFWFHYHSVPQCSRELQVCGVLGPCVSLGRKNQSVSDTVRGTFARLVLPLMVYLHMNLVVAGNWCWWHLSMEDLWAGPLYQPGHGARSVQSGGCHLLRQLSLYVDPLWFCCSNPATSNRGRLVRSSSSRSTNTHLGTRECV